jgi:hypothetical protein
MADMPPQSLVGRGGCLFKDRSGEWWRVCEWKTLCADDVVERALVFESGHVVRRVHTFPDRWLELSDDALEALMSPPRPDAAAHQPGEAGPSDGQDGAAQDRTH